MNRLALCVLLVAGLSACPTSMPMPDAGGPCSGAGCACAADSDCGAGLACDLTTSACFVTCRIDDDCNHHPSGPLAQCAGELGCRCDDAQCFAAQCSIDAECSTGACRGGVCVEAPAVQVTECEVVPALVVARAGEGVTFSVLLRDATGPVVGGPTPAWTSQAPLSGQGAGSTATLTVQPGGDVDRPVPAVRVDVGGVHCEASVLSIPEPAAGELVVSVTARASSWPVDAAQVVLSDASGATLQTAMTGAGGWARLTAVAGATVSVFHPDFSYRTVVGAGGQGVVAVELTRNPADRRGGIAGTVELPLTANLHLGRLGLSSRTAGTSELSDEFEPTVVTRLRIGSAINGDLPMPISTSMGFADQTTKNATAIGEAGHCLGSSGQLDVTRVSTGACGRSTAWALLGDVPLADFPADEVLSGREVNLLTVLMRLQPRRSFASFVKRDVDFGLQPLVVTDGGVDFAQVPGATPVPVTLAEQVPAGFVFLVKVPPLPAYDGQRLDRVAVAGVAVTPRGDVPLGFGAAPNTQPLDETVDGSTGGVLGRVTVRMAPAHHGLEGSAYAALIQASSTAHRTDAAVGFGESTLEVPIAGALTFDPRGHAIQPTGELLALPEGGRLDVPARRFTLASQAGAQVAAVGFVDRLGARWDVLVDAASPAFVLPAVPGALRDRLFLDGNLAARANVEVTTVAFAQGDFASFVSTHQAPRPARWAREVQRPIALRLGLTPGASLAAAAEVPVEVEGFRVGTDGVVRVTVAGGIQCPDLTIDRATDLSGHFAPMLAASCRGNDVTVTAELLDLAASPLVPPVRASARVSIR